MKFIYREDDVSKDTDIAVFKYIHNQFLDHHKTHTVAFICKDLEKNKELINYVNKTHNWNLCIHGWTHDNYSLLNKEQIEEDLDNCILKIEELFGVTPEKWYLPWNGWTKENGYDLVTRVADISIYHGIDVDTDCSHIKQFIERIEAGEKPITNTIYFHGWDGNDLKLLSNLLFLTNKGSTKKV